MFITNVNKNDIYTSVCMRVRMRVCTYVREPAYGPVYAKAYTRRRMCIEL